MTDRKLLKQAAKAAGYDETRTCIDSHFWILNDDDDWHPWNPLTDDGDALRLAVKLRLCIEFWDDCVDSGRFPFVNKQEFYNDDPYAATRRAIVRAAAEIGKTYEQN